MRARPQAPGPPFPSIQSLASVSHLDGSETDAVPQEAVDAPQQPHLHVVCIILFRMVLGVCVNRSIHQPTKPAHPITPRIHACTQHGTSQQHSPPPSSARRCSAAYCAYQSPNDPAPPPPPAPPAAAAAAMLLLLVLLVPIKPSWPAPPAGRLSFDLLRSIDRLIECVCVD